jgi:hypothetical protein
MSANHDGYEQAMRDVIGVLDAADALGGSGPRAVRVAIERLRENNLRYRAEREVADHLVEHAEGCASLHDAGEPGARGLPCDCGAEGLK